MLLLLLGKLTTIKREGITTDRIEWFVRTVNTGMYKIPEIQKQYAKIQEELEAIDYKKIMAKYRLDDMNKTDKKMFVVVDPIEPVVVIQIDKEDDFSLHIH
jgi:hypothetical protein